MTSFAYQEKEQKEPRDGLVPFERQLKGTGFSDRLKKVIGNKSGRAFAKEVGISYSTLHNYLTNASSPTLDNLIALSNTTGVDMKWLATGEEEQIDSRHVIQATLENLAQKSNEHILMIPSYSSINVSAGFGSFNEGVTEADGKEPYSDNLLQQLRVRPHHCAVFWANGNSMLPTIDSGDQLLVDLSKKEIRGNHIYLVQNEGCVWVKRVKMKWDSIELISDNKEEYEPIIISKDEAEHLQIIGQVVHIGHSLV